MTYEPLGTITDLPTYIKNGDFLQQQTYFELLSLILTRWFNNNGFYQPILTDADVTDILAVPAPPPPGTHWFNTTQNKMQFIDNTGNVQTITSV